MTLIFNLWAVPVGIVIYCIMLGLEHLAPALMAGSWSNFVFGVVTTLVGAITELVGIRGRFFLMPVWTFGLAIICYHLGWPGRIALAAFLIGGLVWAFMAGKKKEVVDWQKAQEELAKAGAPPAKANEGQLWEWVKATLFLPTWMNFTPELCRHNLKVVRAIQASGLLLTAEEGAKIHALEHFLTKAESSAKPPGSEIKIQNAVNDLIQKRLGQANKSVGRQELAAARA